MATYPRDESVRRDGSYPFDPDSLERDRSVAADRDAGDRTLGDPVI